MISNRSRNNASIRELEIFDQFKVDKTLPKYAGNAKEQADGSVIFNISNNVGTGTINTEGDNNVWLAVPSDGDNEEEWGGVSVNGDTSIDYDGKKKLHILRRLQIAFTMKRRIERAKKRNSSKI